MTELCALPAPLLRLVLIDWLDPMDAFVARGVNRHLRTLVPRGYAAAARNQLYLHAAARGYISRLLWLSVRQRIAPGLLARKSLSIAAAHSNDLKVLCWVMSITGNDLQPPVYDIAAARGNLPLLEFLVQRQRRMPAHVCEEAAAAGHVPVLAWAQRKLVEAVRSSISGSRRSVDQFSRAEAHKALLVDAGLVFDERVCAAAARGNQLVALQWLRANDCPWDETTMSEAAGAGALEALRWAGGQGCPWDERCCEEAVRSGQLEALRWARTEGCPWTPEIREQARLELGYIEEVQE